MSSPVSIPIPIPIHDASPSSSGLYVPVHRRTPGSYSSSSSSCRTPSPSPSSSPALDLIPLPYPTTSTLVPTPTPTLGASAPAPTSVRGIYTPAELFLLSTSPLAKLSTGDVDALRVLVPEVVQTRKQRKALAWHARHLPTTTTDAPRSHRRTSSRGSHAHSSESEEERATTWRRI